MNSPFSNQALGGDETDIDQQERTRLRSRLIADVTRVQRGFHVVAMRMRSHELESDARFCAKSPPPPNAFKIFPLWIQSNLCAKFLKGLIDLTVKKWKKNVCWKKVPQARTSFSLSLSLSLLHILFLLNQLYELIRFTLKVVELPHGESNTAVRVPNLNP